MRNKLLVEILVLFCFCVLIFAQPIQGQTTKKRKVKNNLAAADCQVEYNDVINYLFPKYLVGLGNGYSLILKYTAQSQPEMQINIFHIAAGKFEVYLYKPKTRHENDSVLSQLQDIQLKKRIASFSEVIRQIKVEKIRISLTEEEILKFRADFFDVVKKSSEFEKSYLEKMNSNSVNVTLDSPYYEVSYSGGGNIKLAGEGNSVDGNPSDDEPLFIEWMRAVYKLVKAKQGL